MEGIITKVSENNGCYSITADGWGLGLDAKYGVVPRVGDLIKTHGELGQVIRGVDLNGKRVFYKSDEQLQQERHDWIKENEKEKQAKYEADKATMDDDYESLPDVFRQRIDRFRRNNPRFRVDYEGYELFCCKEAVKIASTLKTAVAVQAFRDANYEIQKQQVPDLDEGHSGNTFGAASVLAFLYLDSPENVPKMHGALSPLVGSEEYGDIDAK